MRIKVVNLETGEHKTLIDPGTFPRYAATGHLVYAWAGDLLAAPFDLETLDVTGPPVVVQKNILVGWSGNAHFNISRNGTLFYVPRDDRQLSPGLPYTVEAVWVDRHGHEEAKLPDEFGPFFNVRLSPDGTLLAAHKPGKTFSVWVYDLQRSTGRPISPDEAHGFYPLWTSDGSGIVYSSSLAGPALNMFLWEKDDHATARLLIDRPDNQVPQAWAADGTKLIFTEPGVTGYDILEVSIDGDAVVRPLLATAANETEPVMSPDGRWLAYTSDMTGFNEVFVRRYPDLGFEKQVSTNGGDEPLWAPDGKTLYYRAFRKVMAVNIHDDGEELRLGEPRLLVDGKYLLGGVRRNYDLSPDGSRFLMLRMPHLDQPPTEFVVVVNWFEELKRIMQDG
jgi:serine/threonine-protein kinase